MPNKKERILAIDYFRGVCILIVLLSHFAYFKTPLTYLSGEGRLWTSAAEMFFLLSGITLGVVRSKVIAENFWATTKKMWYRAYDLYLLNILVVLLSLLIALKLAATGHSYYMPGGLPAGSSSKLLINILTLKYSFGWASFLMFYAGFMVLAPLAMRLLQTRLWLSVPLGSLAVFLLSVWQPVHHSPYVYFLVWQLYFFIGLTLAKYRLKLLTNFWSARTIYRRVASYTVLSLAAISLVLSIFLSFKTHVILAKITAASFIPALIKNFAAYLTLHQPYINHWLQNNRAGLLRPLFTLLIFAAGYLMYQTFKTPLLKYTGNYVMTMGKNTLWIFVAQAIAIPVLASMPVNHQSLAVNTFMTIILLGLMWAICQRRILIGLAQATLKTARLKLGYIYLYSFKGFTDEN